jgi:hypothetical protein
MTPFSTFCFIASIETGIATTTLFLFINACLAFAGEAALYFGLLSAISLQVTGNPIPSGTALSKGLHQLLIGLGAYALLGAIFGFFALLKRNLRFAQGLYIVLIVSVVLSAVIAVISLFAGASASVLLIQLPALLFNLYLALIARSFVFKLKSDRGTSLGDDIGEGSNTRTVNTGQQRNGIEHLSGEIELDTGVSEEDIGIGGNKSSSSTNKVSSLSSSTNNKMSTGGGRGGGVRQNQSVSFAPTSSTNGNLAHKITIGSDLDDDEDNDDDEDAGDLSNGSKGLHPALAKKVMVTSRL